MAHIISIYYTLLLGNGNKITVVLWCVYYSAFYYCFSDTSAYKSILKG